MKYLLILSTFLLSITCFAIAPGSPMSWGPNQSVKLFTPGYPSLLSGSANPTVSAQSGAPGSLYIRTSTGDMFIKTDQGSSLNWSKFGIDGGAVSSVNGKDGAVNLTTSDISEGTNLYFTNSRSRAAFSSLSPINYNSSNGQFTIPTATATNAGVITTSAQSFSGNKTFINSISAFNFSGSSSGTNTGDVVTGTANGLSLSGQTLSLQTASASAPGSLSASDYTRFNFAAAPLSSLYVYVDKNRTDNYTPDGTMLYPYKSIHAANTAITDASSSKIYMLIIAPGDYVESTSLVIKPNVFWVSLNKEGVTVKRSDSSTITCDIPTASSSHISIYNIKVLTGITMTHSGGLTHGSLIDIGRSSLGGDLTFNGVGAGEDFVQLHQYYGRNVTLNAVSLIMTDAIVTNNLTIGTAGGTVVDSFGSMSEISIASSFYYSLNLNVANGHDNYVQLFSSTVGTTLTAAATGTGTLEINADATSLPPVGSDLIISGAGVSTTLLTRAHAVGFAPAVSGNWSPAPSDVTSALDQLAASANTATPNNTASTVVKRNSGGSFSASGITATVGAFVGALATPASNAAFVFNGGHIKSTQTTAPTALVNANAGTGATCSVSNATDSAGIINLTTTAVAPSSGAQCAITFNKAYNVAPICTPIANSNNSALFSAANGVYFTTTTGTLIVNYANADAAGHANTWMYHCLETQ